MAIERTLSIIKPDAVCKNIIGKIYSRFENAGLQIIAAKMLHMDKAMAEQFYVIHQGKPFFDELVEFMTSAPVMVQVLEGKNAVALNRELMGATNPAKRKPGTIRGDFSDAYGENAVHGSDSLDNAKIEINFFFADNEIHSRC